MFLKELKIIVNGKIIRSILFKKGLNLITSSGNSVGKTTLLRAVDYCFGSDGEDFYKDTEFKNSINQTVYDFLKNNDVYFELIFEIEEKEIMISRGIFQNKTLKINKKDFSKLEDFKEELNIIIFGIYNNKPSFRDMMSKFIRKDILKMRHIIRTLHQTKSKNDYMLFYFQLFNFKEPELIFEKYLLENNKKKVIKKLSSIKEGNNKNSIKQKIKLLDKDIIEINEKIQKLDLVGSGEYSLDRLKVIQERLYDLRTYKGGLNLKLSLNNESLNILSKEKTNVDIEFISEIYNSAKIYLGSINKTLEDTINFHNKMIDNKIKFIESKISNLNNEIKDISNSIKLLEREESEILNLISDKNSFSGLYKLQNELTMKAGLRGEEKKLLDLIENLEKEKEDIKFSIDELDKKIKLYYRDLDNNLFIFNQYFKKFSKYVYGSDYYLSFTDDYEDLEFGNINFNVGLGEKKAYICLFDFAYIKYLNDIGSNYCKFVLHDSIEDTNPESLRKIFKLSNDIGGQYIVSLLEDKIKTIGFDNFKDSIILKLNEANKFFLIEN